MTLYAYAYVGYIYTVPPMPPEVAVPSAQWKGGYTLFVLLVFPQTRPVHSPWLALLCGIGFHRRSDCSPTHSTLVWKGPPIKYVTLFLANFDLTLCHTSRDPPKIRYTSRTPRILVGLVQKPLRKAPCTNSLSIVRGGFCPGVLYFVWKVLSGVLFVRSSFCRNACVSKES